jgi:hypothetical protein
MFVFRLSLTDLVAALSFELSYGSITPSFEAFLSLLLPISYCYDLPLLPAATVPVLLHFLFLHYAIIVTTLVSSFVVSPCCHCSSAGNFLVLNPHYFFCPRAVTVSPLLAAICG